MPRRDANAERRRCNQACEGCRKRKEKCDTLQPCTACVKRGMECDFRPAASQLSTKSNLVSTQFKREHRTIETRSSTAPTQTGDYVASNELSRSPVTGQSSPTETDEAIRRTNSIDHHLSLEAPVPQMARLLHDGRGRFVYVGDSANFSFLQALRQIALDAVGDCDFASDGMRSLFLEQPSSRSFTGSKSERQPGIAETDFALSLDQAEMLANQYLVATACVLDLFDVHVLVESLQCWKAERPMAPTMSLCLVHLVMAIGAQVTAGDGWNEVAERSFERGRQLALQTYTDEPSIQTVQAFILIAMYLLSGIRRNAAFMNLGIAVRAAYTLGLHRRDIREMFPRPEKQLRERIWQSLRVIDLFLSTTLGRPPATSEVEDDSPKPGSSVDMTTTDDCKSLGSVSALCAIFERILSEVYSSHSVSVAVAKDISKLYRQWSDRAPLLRLSDALASSPTVSSYMETARKVGRAHLLGAYHWSIILLTRPFLLSYISWRQQNRKAQDQDSEQLAEETCPPAVAAYADACVDSAMKALKVVEDLLSRPGLPSRLPWITNCAFNSALAIGAAAFGDLDRTYPLNDFLAIAIQGLGRMSANEPQAQRYSQIVAYLSAAARDYLHRRDTSCLQHRQQKKIEMFGIVETTHSPLQATEAPRFHQQGQSSMVTTQPISRQVNDWSARKMSSATHAMEPHLQELLMFDHIPPARDGMGSPNHLWGPIESVPPLRPSRASPTDTGAVFDSTGAWSSGLSWPVPDLPFEHYVPNGQDQYHFASCGG